MATKRDHTNSVGKLAVASARRVLTAMPPSSLPMLLRNHVGNTLNGCAPYLPASENINPPLHQNRSRAQELLHTTSVAAAQARVRSSAATTCNLTQMAISAPPHRVEACCSSQTLAWLEIMADPVVGPQIGSKLSCATAVARALGRRRVAFIGDSVLAEVVRFFIHELGSSTAGGFGEAHLDVSRDVHGDEALKALTTLCAETATPCTFAAYASGLEIVGIKAYGFYRPSEMSAAAQATDARGRKVSKVETRVMAAALAYADLVLLEPCATHANSLNDYTAFVDAALESVTSGLPHALQHRARGRQRGTKHWLNPRVVLPRVAFLEDVPQHFGNPHGWYATDPNNPRHITQSSYNSGPCTLTPENASLRIQSRAELLHLETYLRLATRRVERDARHRALNGGVTDAAAPAISSVLSPKVVRVAEWMRPFGVMSRCGDKRHKKPFERELWQAGKAGRCDCTHHCGSPLTFVPWFSGLHEALPALLAE